ncbi:TMEM175 family protein [Streptomyces sp. NPDC001795]|uniref:TMEM175 family protein n=1 Tax=Streptomyces sp. NPDC001795 TaxID=3154525 RepID=UPI00332E9FF7
MLSFGLLRRDLVVGPERLAMLGDAVFAIAITLLAFEITVPEGLPESHVAHAVRDAMPTVGAYLFSFAVIGALWPAQHAPFHLITTLDRWLLYLCFALLAVVATLPFPTRLISEYGGTATATGFYAAAIALSIALLCGMYLRLLTRPALAASHAAPARLREAVRRSLLMALVFAGSLPVAFFSPTLAKCCRLLAIPVRLLFREAPTSARDRPRKVPVRRGSRPGRAAMSRRGQADAFGADGAAERGGTALGEIQAAPGDERRHRSPVAEEFPPDLAGRRTRSAARPHPCMPVTATPSRNGSSAIRKAGRPRAGCRPSPPPREIWGVPPWWPVTAST